MEGTIQVCDQLSSSACSFEGNSRLIFGLFLFFGLSSNPTNLPNAALPPVSTNGKWYLSKKFSGGSLGGVPNF